MEKSDTSERKAFAAKLPCLACGLAKGRLTTIPRVAARPGMSGAVAAVHAHRHHHHGSSAAGGPHDDGHDRRGSGRSLARQESVSLSREKREIRAATRVQRFWLNYHRGGTLRRRLYIAMEYSSALGKIKKEIEMKQGCWKLLRFLLFVGIFYAILGMQSKTQAAYDVHDVIHNSMMNLEWSHTNDWLTVDNIGANPGEDLTDNVWSFITNVHTMLHRRKDNRRQDYGKSGAVVGSRSCAEACRVECVAVPKSSTRCPPFFATVLMLTTGMQRTHVRMCCLRVRTTCVTRTPPNLGLHLPTLLIPCRPACFLFSSFAPALRPLSSYSQTPISASGSS